MPFQRELRDLAFVPRWGIARTYRKPSVAEHSFFVAIYALQICRLVGWDYRHNAARIAEVLSYSVWHDVSECFESDPPGPFKRATQDPGRALTFRLSNMDSRFGREWWGGEHVDKDVAAIVKAADCIDEIMWLAGERQMGNRSVVHVWNQAMGRLSAAWEKLPFPDEGRRTAEWVAMLKAITDELDGNSRLVEEPDVGA